jgi:hypothetical protein
MNHRHRKVLHALFAHPISGNIDLKDIASVLRELGAEVEHDNKGRLSVRLNGRSAHFAAAHRSVPKDEVVRIRKFIESCGIDPARDYPV